MLQRKGVINMPSFKDFLAKLFGKKDKIDPADQKVLEDLMTKYGVSMDDVPLENEQEVKAPESTEPTPAEAPKEDKPEEPSVPKEEPKQETAPEVPAESTAKEEPVEKQPEEPKVEDKPATEAVKPEAEVPEASEKPAEEPKAEAEPDYKQLVLSLSAKMDSIVELLSKVAIREPVSDEEAQKIEDKDLGMKGKSGNPNVKEADVHSELVKKLGGTAQ